MFDVYYFNDAATDRVSSLSPKGLAGEALANKTGTSEWFLIPADGQKSRATVEQIAGMRPTGSAGKIISAFREKIKGPAIRTAVIARAKEREWTAYGIAKQSKGAISEDSMTRYLSGSGDLTSEKIDSVLKILGLAIR